MIQTILEFIRQGTLFVWGVLGAVSGLIACFYFFIRWVAGEDVLRKNDMEKITTVQFGLNILVWGSLIYTSVHLLRTVFAG